MNADARMDLLASIAQQRAQLRAAAIVGLTVALTFGGATAVMAETTPAPVDPGYVTVAWVMPAWIADTTPSWPQTLLESKVTATPDITALDGDLTECGTQYQVDVYHNDDTTVALVAGKHLDGPNDPHESLIGGGWGSAYKLILNPACPVVPPVVPPTAIPVDPPTLAHTGLGDTSPIIITGLLLLAAGVTLRKVQR